MGEAEKRDGQVFISKDKQATIRVYGGYSNKGVSDINTSLKQISMDYKITYKVVKANYFIVSGYDTMGKYSSKKTKVNNKTGVIKTTILAYSKPKIKKNNNYCKIIANIFN